MKNLLLLSLISLFFANMNAQEQSDEFGFKKNDVFVTGTIGYNSTSNDDFKRQDLTISPSVGYFFNDNFFLELLLIYSSSKIEEDFGIDEDFSALGFAIRPSHLFSPEKKFSFLFALELAYLSSKFNGTLGGESRGTTLSGALRPGINFFLSKNFSIASTIGILNYSSFKPDSDLEPTNTFNLGFNLSNINFSLVYKI